MKSFRCNSALFYFNRFRWEKIIRKMIFTASRESFLPLPLRRNQPASCCLKFTGFQLIFHLTRVLLRTSSSVVIIGLCTHKKSHVIDFQYFYNNERDERRGKIKNREFTLTIITRNRHDFKELSAFYLFFLDGGMEFWKFMNLSRFSAPKRNHRVSTECLSNVVNLFVRH